MSKRGNTAARLQQVEHSFAPSGPRRLHRRVLPRRGTPAFAGCSRQGLTLALGGLPTPRRLAALAPLPPGAGRRGGRWLGRGGGRRSHWFGLQLVEFLGPRGLERDPTPLRRSGDVSRLSGCHSVLADNIQLEPMYLVSPPESNSLRDTFGTSSMRMCMNPMWLRS
jgi:hypothetical protein